MNIRKSSLVAAFAFAALAGCAPQGPTLHVYTWADYFDPEIVAEFETRFDCRVAIDTFDSNEAMFAKIQAGSTGYDLFTPSSYQIPLMAQSGMIMKLDKAQLPNVAANFDEAYRSAILDQTMTYNIPYAVTYTGLAYRRDRIGEAPIDSWAIFEDAGLKGRMALLSDMRETIGAALMYLGYPLNSRNPDEINRAADKVIEWKRNVAKFDNEQYKTAVASSEWFVGHGYSSDTTQIMQDDDQIGFSLPKEGFSIACDELVISAEAPNPELAHAFINFLYDADIARRNMEYVMAPMPVKPALEALDAAVKPLIVVPPETLARGQVLADFDDNPQIRELYVKAWDRIKATAAQ